MRWQTRIPFSQVDHLSMRFRRPRRRQRPLVYGGARRDHGSYRSRTARARPPSSTASPASTNRPAGASRLAQGGAPSSDEAVESADRLPDQPHDAGLNKSSSSSCSSAWRTTRSHRRRCVARTFQNIRLFPGMTVLENLIVAQHKHPDEGVRAYGIRRPAPHPALVSSKPKPAHALERARAWLEVVGLLEVPRQRSLRQICPTARRGGSRSRAPCARSRFCSASTSRQPVSTIAKARS